MDKAKGFLIDHGEKLFFGILALFCLYSMSVSIFGLMSAGNDYTQIVQHENEIKKARSRDIKENLNDHQEFVGAFRSKYTDFSDLDKVRVSLQTRVFTEETKVDPYVHVKDVIEGHTNANTNPGPNCEKLFCKIRGENVCLVCGSRGEREYEFFEPVLTNVGLLPEEIAKKYPENPFVDREEVRIVWEDHIQSDRTTYKKRLGRVYRFEVSEALEKSVGSHVGKPTYHQAIMAFIRENPTHRLDSVSKEGYLQPVSLSKPLAKSTTQEKPRTNAEEEVDLFGNGGGTTPADPVTTTDSGSKEVHKLITEDVFYVMVDKTFKPLKKYWYVLLEEAHGESVQRRPINAIRFSEPVEVITGAENYFFLSRVKPKMDGTTPVEVGGKPVLTAEIQIYQYFKLQNIFYKYVFSRLEIGDPIGTVERSFKGEIQKEIFTSIKKTSREFLKGTDLKDAEWASYRDAYPKSFENLLRSRVIKVDLNYDTGYTIVDINSEEVSVQKVKGREPDGVDENGRPKYRIIYEEVKVLKHYIDAKNNLTGEVLRCYEESNSEINSKLAGQKIKTTDDLR